MSNPIIDVNEDRANDPAKLPLLDADNAKPFELPPKKDDKPEKGDKPDVPPVSAPKPTPPPTIQPEPQPGKPPKLFDPTFVDRGINTEGATGQGFGGQQGLTRIAAPDVLRNIEAQEQFREGLDKQIDQTTQEDVQPYLFDPPPLRDLMGSNQATYNAIYNDALRGDAAMAAADAARILPQYTPQRTKPADSAFDWIGSIIGQRKEGAREYINMSGSLLGPLIYGFGLAQNTVVGAALDVRTQLSRAVTAFVPPWMRANAVGYLQRLESSPQTPLAQNIIGGLKAVAGVNSNLDKLNDGRSNVIEALRGAQYSFSDKASKGAVGIDQDKGFRVGPAKGKTMKVAGIELKDGFDVNPGMIGGLALDVVLGGRVDRLLGKAVRKVVPKKIPTPPKATAAQKEPATVIQKPVEYDQPGLPFVPNTKPKTPKKAATPEQRKAQMRAARKLESSNKKQLKRNAEIKLAEMQRRLGDEQLVLPIPQVMKEYERQLPKYAVKMTPKQTAAQLTLPLGVESRVPPQIKAPEVSPALKKELAKRLSVPPKQVDQLMLRLPDNIQERMRQAQERIAEFTKGMPEALPPRKGEVVRQGELPLGDVSKRSRPPKQLPGSAKAIRLQEKKLAQMVANMPEVRQIELDYTNWLRDGEDVAQGVLDLGGVRTAEDDLRVLENAFKTPDEINSEFDRLAGMLEDQPLDFTLPIDWNTRFPEVFEAPLVPPLEAEVIDTMKRTGLVDELVIETVDGDIVPEPGILGGTPDRALIPPTSSGKPTYTDYRMNLKKRDEQQLAFKLDVPRVKVKPESTAQSYTPKGPAEGRQGILFTSLEGPDGIEYRATKAVRDAVEPPTPRPPQNVAQLRGAQDVVEAASQMLDDTAEAVRIEQLAKVDPADDVVQQLDETLIEMPEIIGGTPEVQAVAELANATRRAEVTNLVVGKAVAKLKRAKENLDNTPDIGRRFTTEVADVPRSRYVKVSLPLTGSKGEFFHGSRVADLDLTTADPLLGGARHELGIGHYLTNDPKVAKAAALANVSENLPPIERGWAEPKVYSVELRAGDKTIDALMSTEAFTDLARSVGQSFPEFAEAIPKGPMSLTDVYDLAADTMSEARQLAFQRHMAMAMLEMDYRRVRAGRTLVVLDPSGIAVRNVEVLPDAANVSADMGQRVVLEKDAVTQTNSLVAKANAADAEVRHAAQVVEDVQPIMEQVEAEVVEAVDNLKLMDDLPSFTSIKTRFDNIDLRTNRHLSESADDLPSNTNVEREIAVKRSARIQEVLTPRNVELEISAERTEAFKQHSALLLKTSWSVDDLAEAEALTKTLKANGDMTQTIALRDAINRKAPALLEDLRQKTQEALLSIGGNPRMASMVDQIDDVPTMLETYNSVKELADLKTTTMATARESAETIRRSNREVAQEFRRLAMAENWGTDEVAAARALIPELGPDGQSIVDDLIALKVPDPGDAFERNVIPEQPMNGSVINPCDLY